MPRHPLLIATCAVFSAASSAVAQTPGAASIEQLSEPSRSSVGIRPVDATRSSPTVQNPAALQVPPLVSSKTLAACKAAQAADRLALKGIDCVRSLQAAAPPAPQPTAEKSLLGMLGQNAEISNGSHDAGGSISADRVARQLSTGDIQDTESNDVAASIARDRPPPSVPPPR